MKTVKEWLETIEDEVIRKKALDNMIFQVSNSSHLCKDVSDALEHAFVWVKTKEGDEYWRDIYHEFNKTT